MNYLSIKSIPQELVSYRKVLDEITNSYSDIDFSGGAEINRDSRGRIVSVNYYSADNELYKQVYFDGDFINAIHYYRNDKLFCKEVFDAGYLNSKYFYKKDSSLAYEIHYAYNKAHQLESLCKKNSEKEITVTYSYDSLDRIIKRKIFLNSMLLTSQQYRYDALNRVVEYKDENQRIVVKNISRKNELISYSITDKIENEIIITNHFTETGYVDTEFTLNGHSTTVKDTSYADNVMLKRPFANEDDLDFIISGLYNTQTNINTKPDNEDIIARNSMGLIDKNIKLKTLPISIRKRVLYNIAIKTES